MIYHGRIRKNNKSKLLIFHGPCAILVPPSSIRSSLAGTEPSPLMRYETYTFFVVVNLRGIPGKPIWQLSHASNGKISGRHLSTKLEKKRIPTEHFLITNPRSQPKSEDPNFSHIPTNFLIAAQFVPFSWMVFLVGLLNPPTPPPPKKKGQTQRIPTLWVLDSKRPWRCGRPAAGQPWKHAVDQNPPDIPLKISQI